MFFMDKDNSLKKSLDWFLNSGVMPQQGINGIAERIVLTENNPALAKIKEMFPNTTEFNDHWIVENRRADCCFETALLFLLAAEYFNNREYRQVGENILAFLFEKSDLRRGDFWNWFTPCERCSFWFDDNGWVAAIEIFIGKRYPELDEKYHLQEHGKKAAIRMGEAILRILDSKEPIQHGKWPEKEFAGEPRQPHWGTPVCVALILAGEIETAREYHRRGFKEFWHNFGLSEWTYALISSAFGAATGDEFFKEQSQEIYRYLKAHEVDGILPSEHCEAPSGTQLADLIYTLNWYLAGLYLLPNARKDFEKLRDFMISIQNPDGSWQGMYDISCRTWAGGDLYEGGANSLYTGWTNTVIAMAMMG